MNISELFKKYGTDKGTHHNYGVIYDSILSQYKHSKIQFCEIGVLRGASLRAWKEYFTNSEIIGFDLVNFPNVAGVKIHKMNQENKNDMYELIDYLKIQPTIIIEDGGHKPEHHQKTLAPFFKALKSGGIYVIEDLQVCKDNPKLNKKYDVTPDNNTITYLKSLLSSSPMNSPYLNDDEELYLKNNIDTISFEANDKLAIIKKK